MAQFINMFPVELTNGPEIVNIKPTYQGNANANRIGAIVTEYRADVSLGGRCAGLCVRADGNAVPLTGTVTGNQAYVTLDGRCYEVPGQIIVFVTWVASSSAPAPESIADTAEETTLLCVYGNVVATSSGSIIQPVEHLPDYAQLLAAIEDMEDATEAANAAAENAASNIAFYESDSTADIAHVPGTASQYFNYNGTLYQATETIAKGGTITPGTNCLAVPSSTMSGLSARVSENHNAAECLYDVQDASSFINSSSTNASYNISGSTGKWVRNEGNTTSKIVPIPPGVKKITVTAHATNGSIYAFLQDGTPVANDYPVYADEYPARFDDGKMRTREFKVEADMGFLYILTNPSTANKPKTPTVTFDYMRTDPGLSAEHIPADAKAVGDRIGVFGKYVSELPAGYKQVEYVESTGVQTLETDFVPDQDTRLIVDFLIPDKSGSATNYVFGTRTKNEDPTGHRRALFIGVSSAGYYYFGRGENEWGANIARIYDFRRHKAELGPNAGGYTELKVDGNAVFTYTPEGPSDLPDTFECPYSALLFGIHRMSGESPSAYYGSVRIYGAQIWDGNNLAKDYVPCVRLSDGNPGMYDLVHKNFTAATVQSGGTQPMAGGTLSTNGNYQHAIDAAENIEQYVVRVPKEYRQVEYIESTGSQTADTEWKPKQTTRMIVDCLVTDKSGANTNYVFGSRTNKNDPEGRRAVFMGVTTAGYYYFGFGNEEHGSDLAIPYDFKRHKVEIGPDGNGRGQLKVDGETLYTAASAEVFTGEWYALLFGTNTTSHDIETILYGRTRIYGAQVYDGGALIRDYVPCVRVVDGTPGMYDLVNGAFAEVELDTSQETPEPAIVGNVLSIASNYGRITAVEEEIGDLNEAVGDIQATLEPKTYIQTEADRVAAKVREVQTPETITFVAVSDMHYSVYNLPSASENPALVQGALKDMRDAIKAIALQTHIDFYASFGDEIYQYQNHGANYNNGILEMNGITRLLNDAFGNNNQIRIVGNHDPNCENDDGQEFSAYMLNSYIGIYSNMLTKDPNYPYAGYGYHDFERQKIRLIVLNTSFYEQGENIDNEKTRYYFGDDQALWLCQVLSMVPAPDQSTGVETNPYAVDDPENWQIVVFSHVRLDSANYAGNILTRAYSLIFGAYESAGTWTKNGGAISYSFSGKNAAKLRVYINGHAHRYWWGNMHTLKPYDSEKEEYPVDYDLSMTNLFVPNALPGRNEESRDKGVPDGFSGIYGKTPSTAESTSFQMITIDPVGKTVYAHHYGAGIDVIMHYYDPQNTVAVNATTAPLTTTLSSPIWRSTNDNVATVNNGAVTGAAAGNVMIWCKSESDNCIEAWNFVVTTSA